MAVAGQATVTADEIETLSGSQHVCGTVCVAPALVTYLSGELEEEANIQKQARKARAE